LKTLVARSIPLIVAMAVLAWCLLFMVDVPLSGDEGFYLGNAARMSDFLKAVVSIEVADTKIVRRIVANGWFPPGMSLVLLPPSLFSAGSPRPETWRIFVALVNALLVVLIARKIKRDFGIAACLTFSAFLALSPGFLSFCSTFWGEVLGGNLVTLAILSIYDTQPGLWRRTISPVIAGVLVGALFFIRSNLVLLFPLYVCWAILILSEESRSARGFFKTFAGHGALFVGAYAISVSPWVIPNSIKHGMTLTTTTLPLSQIAAFGEPGFVDDILRRTDTTNEWYGMYKYFSRRARRERVTYMEAARDGRDRALRNLTLKKYVNDVSHNVDRYFQSPNEFMTRFFSLHQKHTGSDWPTLRAVASALSRIGWGLLLVFGAAAALRVFKPDDPHIHLVLLLKGVLFIYSVQPFVAPTHGRYHVQLVPVLALAAAFWISRILRTRNAGTNQGDDRRVPNRGLVYASQIVMSVFTLVLVILLIA
jgi:hypothetical protein